MNGTSPPNLERRDGTERHQTSQVPPPAVPLPQKKDYLLTGVVKTLQEKGLNQQIQSAWSVKSRRTVNQMEQSVREPGDNEVWRYVP